MLKVEIILNNTWSIMLKKKCNIVCFSMIWISDMKERERMTFLIYSKGMKKKKRELRDCDKEERLQKYLDLYIPIICLK